MDVRAILGQIQTLLEQVTLAIELILLFVLLAALLVMLASLVAALPERLREGAVLRTLGGSSAVAAAARRSVNSPCWGWRRCCWRCWVPSWCAMCCTTPCWIFPGTAWAWIWLWLPPLAVLLLAVTGHVVAAPHLLRWRRCGYCGNWLSNGWHPPADCYKVTPFPFPDGVMIRTHLITGFLGVGKTTAILHLLQHKPAHEKMGRAGE